MKSLELLLNGCQNLKKGGIESPYYESELILSYLLGHNDNKFLLSSLEIKDNIKRAFNELISLRINRQPLAYLIGYQYFYGRKFFVCPGVFIPRFDSEIIIVAVLDYLKRRKEFYNINNKCKALEWGIGTGVLLITLLLEYPHFNFVGLDINPKACEVAEINANYHGLGNVISILNVDGFQYSKQVESGSLDILISNPPYIKDSLLEKLDPEVKNEPITALTGGARGIEVSLKILESYYPKMAFQGRVFLETDNAKLLITEAKKYGYLVDAVFKDLSGWERVVVFKKEEDF